jgi:large conductance mechanosensitive channel
MLKGFRDFVLRGNLVELAVAFVMAAAFGVVVTATVAMLMDIIGKIGGTPDFSNYAPGGVHVGDWLTAVITFVILSFVVYFVIVVPYQKARELMARDKDDELAAVPEDVALLTEIRDLLAARGSTQV